MTLESNTNNQKLCVKVTDEYNQIGEGCSNTYLVDSTNPSISITSTSVTENSITITVSGSDTHSGIAGYRFSSNGGSSYTTVTSSNSTYTYTFTGLTAGTTYNIRVQSVDRAGRVSSVASRSIATDNPNAGETILANYPTILTRNNFSTPVTTTTTGTIYQANDNDGITYYFAGNPTDNWVRFGGFYWRIIRINGDGTIRLIYNGTSTTGSSILSEYEYDTGTRGGIYYYNSAIKTYLESWYSSNLASVTNKIDGNAGFCNDTSMSSSDSEYMAYNRIINTKSPSFYCNNSGDLNTVIGSSRGNKALTYPIGLISADEIAYAGGVYGTANRNFYLYNGQEYWTMSPYNAARTSNGTFMSMFILDYDGSIDAERSADDYTRYARPVINLRADVSISGKGTSTNPYIVN